MTTLYVDQFKRLNKCAACNKETHSGYSLCLKHLEVARQRFRAWSVARREAGLCCYCHRKSYQGFLRCRKHTKENRRRIATWMVTHPKHNKEQWQKRKRLLDVGVCLCREHRPLPSGHRSCDACRARNRELYAKHRSAIK